MKENKNNCLLNFLRVRMSYGFAFDYAVNWLHLAEQDPKLAMEEMSKTDAGQAMLVAYDGWLLRR